MDWYGRQMTSYSKNGITITNTYDAEGVRGSKTVNGSKTTYQYIDGQLYYEKRGDGKELYYLYDSYGNLAMIRMHEGGVKSVYYVSTNWQGDVLALYTYTGTKVAEYEYDAWGNAIVYKTDENGSLVEITDSTEEHIGNINPIRYRGYFYDTDMGLYYVSSRYYDSEIGRFISADGEISGVGGDITGYNLYSYCGNNPVNRIDPDGRAWKDVKNWFSNTWNKVKQTAKKIVTTVKKKAYSVYYKATKWHFEDRAKKNGAHPSYSDVNKKNSGWNLLPKSQSVYHDNGIGKSELKYITDDGREAVFDGDTLAPVTDPRYIATYNYSPLYQMPSSGAGVSDYAKLAGSGIGHFFADMLPYYLTGNSNTREQFESKIFIFD